MNEQCSVSRRSSLKNLGAMGAAMILGRAAAASPLPEEPNAEETKPADEATNAVDVATARLKKGYTCAQSVFSAFAERMGMDFETAVKVASGFGGGMGGAPVCGAVVGAFMALGLKYGETAPGGFKKTAPLIEEFAERFKAQHQSINCRDLLGCDLRTPEGLQTAKEKNLFATVCTGAVADAATILNELLSRDRPDANG